MSLKTVRQAFAIQLGKVRYLDPKLVSYSDYLLLNSGVDRCAIFELASFEQERSTEGGGDHWRRWLFRVKLYQALKDGHTYDAELDDLLDTFLERMHKFPELEGKVYDSYVHTGEMPSQRYEQGGVSFAFYQLNVTITEDVPATEAE